MLTIDSMNSINNFTLGRLQLICSFALQENLIPQTSREKNGKYKNRQLGDFPSATGRTSIFGRFASKFFAFVNCILDRKRGGKSRLRRQLFTQVFTIISFFM